MKVICFGDSNTYGYDPRPLDGGRYDASCRWVDILEAQTGWTVCNLGQNGREIPDEPPAFPPDTDLLIVMLGSNDLLQGRSPADAACRLEAFLCGLTLPRDRLLLIAPPAMISGSWVPNSKMIEDSRTFAALCRQLAARLGIRFADASAWNIPLGCDGVHLTEEGHRLFAAGLLEALRWLFKKTLFRKKRGDVFLPLFYNVFYNARPAAGTFGPIGGITPPGKGAFFKVFGCIALRQLPSPKHI